jgi:S1-C subfamily serine protease
MKPNIAPTSPKYQLEHPIENVYSVKDAPGFERPVQHRLSALAIVLVCLLGIASGVAGVIGANALQRHWPTWSIWQAIGWVGSAKTGQEVIIRETSTIDRQDADRQDAYDRTQATLVSIYRAPSDQSSVTVLDRRLRVEDYRGTGVLVTEDGLVAVDGPSLEEEGVSYVGVTSDGAVRAMTLLARDPLSALGLARLTGEKFSVAAFAVEADLHVGQPLYEMAADALRGPATMGQRSLDGIRLRPSADRAEPESSDAITRFIASRSLGPVVPGAALIDRHGSVIGLRLSGLEESIAIPVSALRRALEQFTLHQEIERVRLGVTGLDLDLHPAWIPDASNIPNEGFLLYANDAAPSVEPGSPADKAGLKDGDVLVSFEGTRLDSSHSLSELVQASEIGNTVTIRYVREGTEQSAEVTLGKIQ